ncbi:peptidase S14, ClpP [Nitrosomonas eutropha C91]|uniref:ATP-dependent Clp protease proteolytic subunit n=1 Tax=Nitrosomonas eutropha (strain DSM 101675 / C91 / Nm57) TaxID=335283 RepID=Q0AG16_NITEC|nr:peptidase S14, ClpP [Nitrosomonas eutropha C91]
MFRAELSGDEATIYLYDTIVSDDFWGGVTAISFVKELMAIKAPVIHLRINSPGGDVFSARAIETAIREHNSEVIAHIDGVAASAASYIALAADNIVIAEGAFYMIHKAWSFAMGNADDLLEMAALLEKVDESLVTTYAKRTGQAEDQIRDWMRNETWFSAAEAVEYGFADSVAEDGPSASASIGWDLSAYNAAPIIRQAQQSAEPAEQDLPKIDTGYLQRIAALARHM